MKLILLGPPAAGKGTQAESIAKRYSLAHISTGDMLRAEIALNTVLGLQAKAIIDRGDLVPDAIINAMAAERIKQADCANGFLLDGYPRTTEQAKFLAGLVSIDCVFNIEADENTLVSRVAARRICPNCRHTQAVRKGEKEICEICGAALIQRPDDTEAKIKNRLKVYYEQTQPLVDFYEKRGLLVKIDGTRSIAETSEQIFDYLNSKFVGSIWKCPKE